MWTVPSLRLQQLQTIVLERLKAIYSFYFSIHELIHSFSNTYVLYTFSITTWLMNSLYNTNGNLSNPVAASETLGSGKDVGSISVAMGIWCLRIPTLTWNSFHGQVPGTRVVMVITCDNVTVT